MSRKLELPARDRMAKARLFVIDRLRAVSAVTGTPIRDLVTLALAASFVESDLEFERLQVAAEHDAPGLVQ